MGCIHSSLNQIKNEHLFNTNECLYLTQSWNIIKIYEFQNFAESVLLRTMSQSPSFRQFWISKIEVDGNNYHYNQLHSCLKTDLSWTIGLGAYGIQFISIFDKFLSVINDENHFSRQIESLNIAENNFIIEYQSLLIMKQCILEMLRERFKTIHFNYTDDHERAWNKLLTFIIEHMPKKVNGTPAIIISPATNNERSSARIVD